MNSYFNTFIRSFVEYFNYLKHEILFPGWDNYFYGLCIISLIVWGLELIFPWRKSQPIFRKDFWLDAFYLVFNFFLLNLILLVAVSNTTAQLVHDFFLLFNINITSYRIAAINDLPKPIALVLFFVISDFLQWNTHRLLHKLPFLWKVHKLHHAVKQMGFAAHFRYHWLEPVVYKAILYIPLMLLGGFDVADVFIVHFIAITIGHLNHANIGWDYGWFKYIFNNPKMHIWHHSKNIPAKTGANFGISLSIWDFIFKTNYVPSNGRDNELGFDDDHEYPKHFIQQELYPLITIKTK